MVKINEINQGAQFLLKTLDVKQLFTAEDLTDEHKMINATAKQFIEKEVLPNKEEIEKQNFELIVNLMHKAGELGLLAHSVPEKYGGLGLDKISKGIVGENVGATGSYGVAHSNHTCIATLPITYFGTEEQKKKYLPKLASGEYIGAYCLTEPNAGSDALSSQTTARLNETGTHYLLNGTKIFITNAVFSDTFIVYAKVDGQHFTAFIVEGGFPGLSLGPEEKKMGIKGSSTRSVILENCEVPVENILGEIGRGHVIALNVLNLGRYNLGFACMGGAKQALKATVPYIRERKQFGKPIAEFPALKEKIAKMSAKIYAAESVQYRTAALLEEALGGLYELADQRLIANKLSEFATECAICKVFGSETLDYVVDEALQLHGGAGFMNDYGIERMYRDSRINRIFEGTNEINRLLIPTHLFRKAMKGDIPLQEKVKEARDKLQKGMNLLEGEFARERSTIEFMRHLFLVCAGITVETFGQEMVHEQEALMRLADMAIFLFGAESAVYRTYKSILKRGVAPSKLKIDLTRTYLQDSLWGVEKLARIHALELCKDEKDAMQLVELITRECSRYQLYGKGYERNRMIAEKQYEAGQFTCS
ncbi:acyl-CoA dehydrogenase family protein [Cytobacillus sp. Hz8]|uniref:acyl-CoA dehydrogenase family protein n=1 Tax=Cytobacillus sp. Hz8 TaxID=3347168 RepID=UPI0035D9623B